MKIILSCIERFFQIKLPIAAVCIAIFLLPGINPIETFGILHGQNIGINTSGAAGASSSIVDVSASNKGMLISRVALQSIVDGTTIALPATSLLVYSSGGVIADGYYYNSGTPASPVWSKFITNSSSGGGCFTNWQLFTANGTFSVPAGITKIKVEVWGGGGGGGGGLAGPYGGGGGGGGGYSEGIYNVTPLANHAVTIGALGGGGAAGANGSAGGTTSFGALMSATGGAGGTAGGNGAGGMSGGIGGTGSGGYLNASLGNGGTGSDTDPGSYGTYGSGYGGTPRKGGGGGGVGGGAGGGVGGNALANSGAGGGGGGNTFAGGNGAAGKIIVWW